LKRKKRRWLGFHERWRKRTREDDSDNPDDSDGPDGRLCKSAAFGPVYHAATTRYSIYLHY
jgi:hypothetical protein